MVRMNFRMSIFYYKRKPIYSSLSKRYRKQHLASGVAGIFFEGERPGHLKAIRPPPPPQGVRGGNPPDGREVSFFKTIQSIRKWIHFSKISTFFLSEKSIFSKKNFEKWNIFCKNFRTFSKNYFKILKFSGGTL